MPDTADMGLPFFDDAHRRLAADLGSWAAGRRPGTQHRGTRDDVDAACRSWVDALGQAGWLRYAVPAAYGGALAALDSRALCVIRDTLSEHDGLADFAFAMQGLGAGPITLGGDETLRERYLPGVAAGRLIAAFALSEPQAGADAAAMTMRAVRAGSSAEADMGLGLAADEDTWLLDGRKTWISNGGIADFYCVFARTSDPMPGSPAAHGITGFVVDADTPGLIVEERIDMTAPHPLATVRFEQCRVPDSQRLGEVGASFGLAMATLDEFRVSVAAAAIGLARRALAEAGAYAAARPMLGGTLADLQLTQATLADMATAIDASSLLAWRAAWLRDVHGARTTAQAAMAEMFATEGAQQVIDRAVRLFGGAGVRSGSVVERLYRESRALRLYEGATEVQKLVIGREWLRANVTG